MDLPTAFLAVFDRVIKLLEKREQRLKLFDEEVLLPLESALMAVRDDYLQSFKEYRKVLKAGGDLNDLCDEIASDSQMSLHHRLALKSVTEALAQYETAEGIEAVMAATRPMRLDSRGVGTFMSPLTNVARTSLLFSLKYLAKATDEELRACVADVLRDDAYMLVLGEPVRVPPDGWRYDLADVDNEQDRRRILFIVALDRQLYVVQIQFRSRFGRGQGNAVEWKGSVPLGHA